MTTAISSLERVHAVQAAKTRTSARDFTIVETLIDFFTSNVHFTRAGLALIAVLTITFAVLTGITTNAIADFDALQSASDNEPSYTLVNEGNGFTVVLDGTSVVGTGSVVIGSRN
jgi:hypothetical protein